MSYSAPRLALWAQLILISSALSFQLQLRRTSSCLFAGQNQEKATTTVQVFDNAFDQSVCEMLHYLTEEHRDRTSDGSSFFTRPPHNERPLTPIEHALDSALIEMGDNTKRVEYWSRDNYMNIDAHADIDEAFLEGEGVVRCPLVAHILYLQVKDGLHGPTCVFPGEQMGWGFNEGAPGREEKDMFIVPAVVGRILRFPGGAMHAVPNPANRWLLSRQEEKALREKEADSDFDDDEDEDESFDDIDDAEDYDDEVERSVILFNSWADDEPGPRGVNGDMATGALPEGIELSEEDLEAFLKSQEAQIWNGWEEEYGKNCQNIKCNPFSEWESVASEEIPVKSEMHSVNVSLMGRESRHLYSEQYAELKGSRAGIESALNEDSRVSRASLALDDTTI
jgi:hypothetical protein